MNKRDFTEVVMGKLEVTKKEAKSIVDTVVESIVECVVEEGEVTLSGFGKFMVVDRAAKMGRNPATGKAVKIPARKGIRFKVAKQFKEAVR